MKTASLRPSPFAVLSAKVFHFAWMVALGLAATSSGSGTVEAAGERITLVHEPAARADHPPLIVLLHGSGADERDMIGLWPQLPAAFVVVSPRAPFADASGGYRWYGKATSPGAREADIGTSRAVIDHIVENAIKRFDADPTRVFLVGFSQGAVMVYEVVLHEPGRFHGAGVLSGSLFPAARAALAAGTVRKQDAFFIGHGTADDHIPFISATAARDALAKRGIPVAFHAYPGMHHGISDAETRDLSDWLTERLAAPNSP